MKGDERAAERLNTMHDISWEQVAKYRVDSERCVKGSVKYELVQKLRSLHTSRDTHIGQAGTVCLPIYPRGKGHMKMYAFCKMVESTCESENMWTMVCRWPWQQFSMVM